MRSCALSHIPQRLHWESKPVIAGFFQGDTLYRRCKPEEIANPFASVAPLCEISHNLGQHEGKPLSEKDDVLLDIREGENEERYKGFEIAEIKIDKVSNGTYEKSFEYKKGETLIIAKITLLHDPEPCMYPHCVFRIWLGDTKVDYQNYNDTLKKAHQLRTLIRQELATMVRCGTT